MDEIKTSFNVSHTLRYWRSLGTFTDHNCKDKRFFKQCSIPNRTLSSIYQYTFITLSQYLIPFQ